MTSKDYWISPSALSIVLNALGNEYDYIIASVSGNARFLCYMPNIPGLGFDDAHNYRAWYLLADPVRFSDTGRKYVYVAIPRPNATDMSGRIIDSTTAVIVYPSVEVDIYGRDAEGKQIGSEQYYYVFIGGIISPSIDQGVPVERTWEAPIDYGTLSTDEALANTDTEWSVYDPVSKIVTFTKEVVFQVASTILAKSLTLAGKLLDSVAEYKSTPHDSNTAVVTPQYLADREVDVEKKYLRKDKDDKTEYGLEVQRLKVNGNAEWGTFVKGIIGGSGAQIDINGNAELESLIIRRFLEVPELRYNRVSVHSGTEWFTKGSGLIESVTPIDDTHGKVKLHLEDGEISTIAEDDYCMGIFHNLNGNADQTTDDKQGTMQFAGFTTVYFRIQEITETAHNSEFIYELRPADSYQGSLPMGEGGGRGHHPQPQMAFACYANPNDKDRQSAVLKTTDYTVYIEKSTQWTFGPDNYYLIMGQLEGFSVWATNKKGERYLKHLHGNGTMLGNVYMFGTIDQFDRLADTVEVTASPRINADFTIADGETLTLTAQMLSYDGIKRTGVIYNIKRYSDNSASDAEWNARRGNDIAEGTILLTTEDTLISPPSTGGAGGGSPVYDPAVQFTITATRTLPTEEGGEDYSVERDIVVKNVGGFTLTDDNADPMIALGEAKHYNFHVNAPRGGDITSKVERWSIERHSSDPTADTLWAMRDKVKAFAGSIDLLWSSDPTENDMDPNETISGTSFLITAYIGTEPIAQEEITL